MTMIEIRPATTDDVPFLSDMGWEAAAVSAEVRAMGRIAALALPSMRKYLEGWGRPGDAGVVAIGEDDRRLGAAWYRLFPIENPAYGFVVPDIPELSIGVVEGERGKGIGHALLEALLVRALADGFRAISLSVDRQNAALQLYERVGFRDAGVSDPDDSSVTMIAVREGQGPQS
jgi:GNAT superfamily N-acetyltransferase